MANPITTNFLWEHPEDGASVGSWGGTLEALFEQIDTDVYAVKTTAEAALPLAGGTVTGDVVFGDGAALGETAKLFTTSIDWAAGNFFYRTLPSGTLNLGSAFANLPATGIVQFITVELTQPGSGDGLVTWPNSIEWQDGVPPTLSTTASAVDVLIFYCRDGSTVVGAHSLTGVVSS